jgi:SAM-dependent methyltransferase
LFLSVYHSLLEMLCRSTTTTTTLSTKLLRLSSALRLVSSKRQVLSLHYKFSSSLSTEKENSANAREQRVYWRKIYENKNDVFTLDDVNPNLEKYWEYMNISTTSSQTSPSSTASSFLPRILVPCCGKDISMVWMVERYNVAVVGVDFVGEPLRALGQEIGGGLKPLAEIRTSAPHLPTATAYQVNSLPQLILLHGDLLYLQSPNDFGGSSYFDACWDRASLTSISQSSRLHYVKKIGQALRPKGKLLLEFLSSNYISSEGNGGVVSLDEVNDLLESSNMFENVKILSKKDVRHDFPNYKPHGLMYLDEIVLVCSRKE